MTLGVILSCTKSYGLVLTAENVLQEDCLVVFGGWTLVGGVPVGEIGPVDEVFRAGTEVSGEGGREVRVLRWSSSRARCSPRPAAAAWSRWPA